MIELYRKKIAINQLFECEKIANLFAIKLNNIGFESYIEKKDNYYFVKSKRIDKKFLEKAKKLVLIYCKLERQKKLKLGGAI
jgi:hypothetical protein